MYKSFLGLLIVLVVVGCNKVQDPFEIGTQHIGFLTDSTQVKYIIKVFG